MSAGLRLGRRNWMNRPNILVSANSTYVMPLAVMLTSLFKNNSAQIDVYLLWSELSAADLELLERLVLSHGSRLIPIEINQEVFQGAPTLKYISRETYFRLLAADYLPSAIGRVLWLDADIIVNGDIMPFYNMDFDRNFVVACSYGDPMRETIHKNCQSLGFPDDKTYFNAGVMLCNLEAWRTLDIHAMIANHLSEGRKLQFPGQDLTNLLFHGHVKIVDYKYYNSMIHCICDKEDLRFAHENAVIIHFPGEAKPWRFHDLPFSDVWAQYHEHCPFGGQPLRRTSYFKLKAAFNRMQRGT